MGGCFFKKHPTKNSSRSVKFLGLAVPGTSCDEEFITAVWRFNENGEPYQNYIAKFTILDANVI